MHPIVIVRPLPVRAVAALTLALMVGWSALNADLSDVGVLAYPAIIAVQTAREWLWRLEVTSKGVHERQGIGAPRDILWKQIDAVLLPDSTWWRVNPALRVTDAPNVQLTPVAEIGDVIAFARSRHIQVVGRPTSVSLVRTLLPWVVVLLLASALLYAEVVGAS